ncbi:MAG: hypothetical protein JXR58_12145 [Bacteroidales bacterium]|nr:hypothetical protein [Bacteroidales bacterium]
MKTIFSISIFSLLIVLSANAQGKGEKFREQMKAKKVAFITSKLDLTVDEAQSFWPVYNEHEKSLDELHDKKRSIMKKIHHNDGSIKDDELIIMIDQLTDIDLNEAKENKSYIAKVKKVLPAGKIVKLFEAEKDFKHTLLKEYKGGHGEGHGGPGGPNCGF